MDLETATKLAWRLDPATFGARLSEQETANVEDDPDWAGQRTATTLTLFPHTRLLGRKYAQAVAGISRRQIWEIGPRYGKTLVGSNWGPVWFLEHFPNKRVILGSYGQALAIRNGRLVRNLIRSHAKVLNVELAKDSQAADVWNTSAGGGLLAAGVGSAMTGFGGDLIVIDDPFKDWQEAQSPVIRDAVWEWYRSVARTRLHKGGAIIIIATRWHKDDLSGRLIAEDRKRVMEGKPPMWDVVRLPTIADGQARGEPDLLGRQDGEVLCAELFPPEEVMDQREELGSANWRAMHQQDPADVEGSTFKREWWRWYDARPEPLEINQWTISVDCNFKERADSSFVVVQCWVRRGPDHYLFDQVRGRWDYVRTKSEIARMYAKWPKVTALLIEDKANGPAIISDLGRSIPGMIPVEPQGSKLSRAQAVAAIPESGHVLLPSPGLAPWISDWMEEVSDFPDSANDDQVDAMSQYLLHVGGAMRSERLYYARTGKRR